MTLPDRTRKALERDPDVIQVADELFLVESFSAKHGFDVDEWYQVDFSDWSCECGDFNVRDNACYHLRAAILKHAKGEVKEV